DEEKLKDPRIWSMLGKITVVADPGIDAMFPGVKRAIVSITTVAGQVYTAQVDNAKGSPENPMSDEEVIDKFTANAEGVMGAEQRARLIDATWALGSRPLPINEFMQLLVI
ncbi:MAG TPA: MmgE/PrpD family protein, partial [bacterium]|nr:MmgE/PrpD family protein [bacterium]